MSASNVRSPRPEIVLKPCIAQMLRTGVCPTKPVLLVDRVIVITLPNSKTVSGFHKLYRLYLGDGETTLQALLMLENAEFYSYEKPQMAFYEKAKEGAYWVLDKFEMKTEKGLNGNADVTFLAVAGFHEIGYQRRFKWSEGDKHTAVVHDLTEKEARRYPPHLHGDTFYNQRWNSELHDRDYYGFVARDLKADDDLVNYIPSYDEYRNDETTFKAEYLPPCINTSSSLLCPHTYYNIDPTTAMASQTRVNPDDINISQCGIHHDATYASQRYVDATDAPPARLVLEPCIAEMLRTQGCPVAPILLIDRVIAITFPHRREAEGYAKAYRVVLTDGERSIQGVLGPCDHEYQRFTARAKEGSFVVLSSYKLKYCKRPNCEGEIAYLAINYFNDIGWQRRFKKKWFWQLEMELHDLTPKEAAGALPKLFTDTQGRQRQDCDKNRMDDQETVFRDPHPDDELVGYTRELDRREVFKGQPQGFESDEEFEARARERKLLKRKRMSYGDLLQDQGSNQLDDSHRKHGTKASDTAGSFRIATDTVISPKRKKGGALQDRRPDQVDSEYQDRKMKSLETRLFRPNGGSPTSLKAKRTSRGGVLQERSLNQLDVNHQNHGTKELEETADLFCTDTNNLPHPLHFYEEEIIKHFQRCQHIPPEHDDECGCTMCIPPKTQTPYQVSVTSQLQSPPTASPTPLTLSLAFRSLSQYALRALEVGKPLSPITRPLNLRPLRSVHTAYTTTSSQPSPLIDIFAIINWVDTKTLRGDHEHKRALHLVDPSTRTPVHLSVYVDALHFTPAVGTPALLRNVRVSDFDPHRPRGRGLSAYEQDCAGWDWFVPNPVGLDGEGMKRWWEERKRGEEERIRVVMGERRGAGSCCGEDVCVEKSVDAEDHRQLVRMGLSVDEDRSYLTYW